jgi:hypothetical protein
VSVLGPSAAGVGKGPWRRYGRGGLLLGRGRRLSHRRRRGLHGPGRRRVSPPRRRVLLAGRGGGLRGRDRRSLARRPYRREGCRRHRRGRRGARLGRGRRRSGRAVPRPGPMLSHRMGGGGLRLGPGDRRPVGPRPAPRPEQDEKRHAEENPDCGRGEDDPSPASARSAWRRGRSWFALRRRQQRRVDQHAALAARPAADVWSAARRAVQTLVDVRFNAAPSHSPAKGSGGRLAPCRGARPGGAADAQTAAVSRTWVSRRWFPDGSRKDESIP